MKTKGMIKTVLFSLVFASTSFAQKVQLGAAVHTIDPTCYNATDGRMTLTVKGGIAPYTILWSTGDTDYSASGLVAGTYDVTVTDATGRTVHVFADLVNPAPILIGGVSTNVSTFNGNNGSIDVNLITNSNDFNFFWSTSNGSGLNTNLLDQSGLTSGTYTLTVVNQNGCSESHDFNILQPAINAPVLVNTNLDLNEGTSVSERRTPVAFPNPSNGTVNFTHGEEIRSIAVYANDGVLVKMLNENTAFGSEEIVLNKGSFTAKIQLKDGSFTHQSIIVK